MIERVTRRATVDRDLAFLHSGSARSPGPSAASTSLLQHQPSRLRRNLPQPTHGHGAWGLERDAQGRGIQLYCCTVSVRWSGEELRPLSCAQTSAAQPGPEWAKRYAAVRLGCGLCGVRVGALQTGNSDGVRFQDSASLVDKRDDGLEDTSGHLLLC